LILGAVEATPASPLRSTEVMMVLLFAVAVLVFCARKVQIPYPIVLVIGGLILGLIPGLPQIRLNPELVFILFLPPLLYPAALFTSWRDFRENLGSILWLAVGLVLCTIVVTAWFAHQFVGLPWGSAFVLGAIIAPSDAVAVTAIAQRLRVPPRIVTILEGESLVNDTTAFVAYRFAIAAVATGSFSLAHASLQFVLVGLGGTAVGLVAGVVFTEIQRRLDDPPVQVTLSLLTPFVAYLGAEKLGCSGVLAVVVCGLYLGWRRPQITGARMRLLANPVWEMVQFILNGVIFILIGLQLPDVIHALKGHAEGRMLWFAAIILVAVIVVRLVWVFVIGSLEKLIPRKFYPGRSAPSWRQFALIGWTGLRGVDSLAAALAVPLVIKNGAPFPGRDLIFLLTFGVILGTLILQGLSLAPIIRWLNLADDHSVEKEERAARLSANKAALARLRDSAREQRVEARTFQGLEWEYEERILLLERDEPQDTGKPGAITRALFSEDFGKLAREALEVERLTILRLRNQRKINDEVLRRIQRDIDLAETRLQEDRCE